MGSEHPFCKAVCKYFNALPLLLKHTHCLVDLPALAKRLVGTLFCSHCGVVRRVVLAHKFFPSFPLPQRSLVNQISNAADDFSGKEALLLVNVITTLSKLLEPSSQQVIAKMSYKVWNREFSIPTQTRWLTIIIL